MEINPMENQPLERNVEKMYRINEILKSLKHLMKKNSGHIVQELFATARISFKGFFFPNL